MNSRLKHLGERGLLVSGIGRLALRAHRGRMVVLAYHDVLPQGETVSGDASLHLAQEKFARQLDALVQSHEVVPITALFDAPPTSRGPRAVITFDDAYQGSLSAGVHELAKRGLPATIFVTPGLLDSTPWWDILAAQNHGAVAEELRRHALGDLRGDGTAILRAATTGPARSATGSRLPRIASETELAAAASKPGITLGSHSWSHRNLSTLAGAELETELARPLAWLQSRFAATVPWLSYPYGLFNESVQRAAANAGCVGAFRIDGGWMPRSDRSPYALPRLNIPSGLSIDGFRLRLAGL